MRRAILVVALFSGCTPSSEKLAKLEKEADLRCMIARYTQAAAERAGNPTRPDIETTRGECLAAEAKLNRAMGR